MDNLVSDFMPHGHCYLWNPSMVWLQVLSNLIVGLAYVSISTTLVVLASRAKGIPFNLVYVAFGAFIVLCGFTHFLDVWTVWQPVYWFDGAVRALTAIVSVATAVWLFPLYPQVVKMVGVLAKERETSRAELEQALTRERDARQAAEALASEVAQQSKDVEAQLKGHQNAYESASRRIAELESQLSIAAARPAR